MITVQERIDWSKKFNDLIPKVIGWAEDRNLIEGSTAFKQVHKTVSEIGELFDALGTNNVDEIKDAIGDVIVTLIIITKQSESFSDFNRKINIDEYPTDHMSRLLILSSELYDVCKNSLTDLELYMEIISTLEYIANSQNLTLGECLESAYNEIKDRKGRMVNGVFVKES